MVDEDICEHLNKFADTVDKLSEMDININDDLLASYENFRIAIESRDELPSPENLKIKILEEDEARKKDSPLKLISNEGAFMSKFNRGKKWHNNSKRFSQNKQESKVYCEYCKRTSHTTRQCRNKNRHCKESRKQKCVLQSTAEAEYVALTDAAKEALHLKCLANDMGIPQDQVVIYNDNQAANNLATNPIVSPRSKHIEIKKHFIREVVQQGDVVISYLDTERMTADMLTKALNGRRHKDLRQQMRLHRDQEYS
jgi:hypothetical protein